VLGLLDAEPGGDMSVTAEGTYICSATSSRGRFTVSQSMPSRPWIVLEHDPQRRFPRQVQVYPYEEGSDPAAVLRRFFAEREEARREAHQ
jgi:hypothetical protein